LAISATTPTVSRMSYTVEMAACCCHLIIAASFEFNCQFEREQPSLQTFLPVLFCYAPPHAHTSGRTSGSPGTEARLLPAFSVAFAPIVRHLHASFHTSHFPLKNITFETGENSRLLSPICDRAGADSLAGRCTSGCFCGAALESPSASGFCHDALLE
jgi:hypothetical protein